MTPTVDSVLSSQREFFSKGITREACFRIVSLKKLRDSIRRNELEIAKALAADLGKSHFESYATEISIVLEEISYHIKNVRRWMKPYRVPSTLAVMPAKSYIHPEPAGVVLIMAPWNYPFQLLMAPLVGAISSGCCAIIKPSNMSPHTSEIIKIIAVECFDSAHIHTFTGGRDVIQELLAKKFDYIFFTGGTNLGAIVAQAAARDLTPITLELGGKSPCIIAPDADLKTASRRIAWGKFVNAGQTCVAPDYVLAPHDKKAELAELIKKRIHEFFGDNPKESPDFGRIITQNHFDRIISYFSNGKVACGGETDRDTRYISPTVLIDSDPLSPVMQDEIFGPVLPIIGYNTIEEAIDFVAQRPKPLAFYLFTDKRKVKNLVLSRISFGGGCINDVVMHLANQHLPFGGVGASGMGSYHGKKSFDAFTHYRGVLHNRLWPDIPIRYAPYTKLKFSLLRKILG